MTLRAQPGDFVVEELLSEEYRSSIRERLEEGTARHAVFLLRRQGVSLGRALGEIVGRLRVPLRGIGSAPLRERHIDAVQAISLPLASGLRGGGPRRLDHRGWSLERLGWGERPVSAASVAGHRYEVVIRNLDEEAVERIDAVLDLLSPRPGVLLLVNYFGDERFGGSEDRELAGPLLVRGAFEAALRALLWRKATDGGRGGAKEADRARAMRTHWRDWPHLLELAPSGPMRRALQWLVANPTDFAGAVAALPLPVLSAALDTYQALLWNDTARRLIAARCRGAGELLVAEDPWGDIALPSEEAIPAELRGLELPFIAPDTELAEPWREAAEAVLEAQKLAREDLRVPGIAGALLRPGVRNLFVEALDVEASRPQPDESGARGGRFMRRVRFRLPRGASASILLRALGE